MQIAYRRSDTPQPASPKIPIPANRPLTNCSPYIERRIRRLLCWHAGAAGLIDHRAVQYIGDMHFAGEVTTRDLIKLASDEVYEVIRKYINERRNAQLGIDHQ